MSFHSFFKKGGAGGKESPVPKKTANEKQQPKNVPWVEKYRPNVQW